MATLVEVQKELREVRAQLKSANETIDDLRVEVSRLESELAECQGNDDIDAEDIDADDMSDGTADY